jgi:DNA polymerase-3 subunit alpha
MEAYVNEFRRSGVRDEIQDLRARLKTDKPNAKSIMANIQNKNTWLKENFRPSRHAIIIAKTRKGYSNLVRMSTDSWKNGFYYSPRTDFKFLEDHAEGLIYSTACIGGHIPVITRNNFDKGVTEAKRIRNIFQDGFFVELMITEYSAQRDTNMVMMDLAKKIGAPMIITCDVHYLNKEDGLAQDVLLLMRDKKTIKDKEAGEGGWQFEAKDLWWRTLEDVVECWKKHHSDYMPKDVFLQALKNTYDLADSVEDWEFDTSLKLPGVFENPINRLKEEVISGMKWRRDRGDTKQSGKTNIEYVDRIRRELDVISKKGFAEYFLILKDITDHARETGARVGVGRGSAGGSLVSYLLRITDIDPMRFDLLFERFLAVDRSDPPDIDLDFSPEHRDRIKAYIEDKYPATATIGNYSTFKPRATLRDVGRVFGIDHNEMKAITKPLGTDADNKTWEEIFDIWPEVKDWAGKYPKAFGVVRTLRGLISHRGKNAAGMLIAPESALDDVPFITERSKDGTETMVTAFPDSQEGAGGTGRELSRLGYLKMDILGVQSLNIAPRAAEIYSRDNQEVIDLETLRLDDEDVLAIASTGDVPGVFQFDTNTSRPILKHVGVDSFDDLVMITALARPGPLKNQIHKIFAKLKKSGEAWKDEVIPELVPLLKGSRGLMILQEDVMHVVQKVGGLTFAEANTVRKIIGKKLDPEKFEPWRIKFVEGGIANGHDKDWLEELWSKVVTFSQYGFNKSHSVAYCITAYRQLYMLAHYPLYYFAALMAETDSDKKDSDGGKRLTRYIRNAASKGIRVLPPCVMESSFDFDVFGDQIRYGLSKIKGVSSSAQYILDARPFGSLEELVQNVNTRKANSRIFECLIYSGALDNLPYDNSNIEFEKICELDIRNEMFMRYHQFRKTKKEVERLTPTQLLERERELIGLSLSWWSSNNKDLIRDGLGLMTIREALKSDRRRFEVLAEISGCRTHKSKRGTMAFLTLSDETADLGNFTVWSGEYSDYKKDLKVGKFVVVSLEKKENKNRRYGRWSYYLYNSKVGKPIRSAAAALRELED